MSWPEEMTAGVRSRSFRNFEPRPSAFGLQPTDRTSRREERIMPQDLVGNASFAREWSFEFQVPSFKFSEVVS